MRNLLGLCRQVLSGLRFRLLLLVLLACAPLVALTLHSAWKDRRLAAAQWLEHSDDLIQAARQDEQELIGETRQLLLALSESADVKSLDKSGCRNLLGDIYSTYRRYSNLGVVSTNGRVLASAEPVQYPIALANNDTFARARDSRSLAIGDFPEAGGPDRLPTLVFAQPVLNAATNVYAIVFAELNMKTYNRFGRKQPLQLPATASWTEIDRKGRILTRHPQPDAWVGRMLPEITLTNAAFQPQPALLETRDASGVPTVYAIRTMSSQLGMGEVAGLLGISRRGLFEPANKALLQNLAWLCVAVGLALGLGWVGSKVFILSPVRALARSSARLAGGDLSVRTGLPPSRDELGQLAIAFDQMAHSLEQREHERELMSRRLVGVQEAERRHIARELHDEIGQSLTAAGIHLQAARQLPGSEPLQHRISQSIHAVEQVLVQVRDLSLNLRPSVLDDLGLESALRWFIRRQNETTGLKTEFQCDALGERLDSLIETECFRIAQEALTNIARHAKAREASVELRKLNGQIHLRVRDDGVGFDADAVRKKAAEGASLGLMSMEERSSLAGGGFELKSSPGKGTEVHAWFPFRPRPQSPTAEAI